MRRILVAGCGYVGSRLASMLADDGDRVWGLRRDPDALPEGVRPLAADVTDASSLEALPGDLDSVVFAVSPDSRQPEAYHSAFRVGLLTLVGAVRRSSPGLSRVLFVSSTGVYGRTDGGWVDETTPPEPSGETARLLHEGETFVRNEVRGAVVLRLGGIYGPGRTGTVRRVLNGEAGCPPPDRYTNRIHRDDAAGALRHLLGLGSPGELYLGVDREPAPLRAVYGWIAHRAGVPDPCSSPNREAAVERRRRTNKRCRSDRLVASGYRFRYPTFQEGYAPLVDEIVRTSVAAGGESTPGASGEVGR